jgi:MFS family permease
LLPLAGQAGNLLVLLGIAMFFSIGMTSIPPIAIGLLLPNRMRGSSIAAYYLVIAMFGVGVGPVMIPWIASYMPSGTGSYTRAMALAGGVSGLLALVLCAFAMIGLRHRVKPPHSNEGSADRDDALPPARSQDGLPSATSALAGRADIGQRPA